MLIGQTSIPVSPRIDINPLQSYIQQSPSREESICGVTRVVISERLVLMMHMEPSNYICSVLNEAKPTRVLPSTFQPPFVHEPFGRH
jgi:hypothetical protein